MPTDYSTLLPTLQVWETGTQTDRSPDSSGPSSSATACLTTLEVDSFTGVAGHIDATVTRAPVDQIMSGADPAVKARPGPANRRHDRLAAEPFRTTRASK